VTIEFRQFFAAANDQRNVREAREQSRERRRHLENNLGTTGCDERRIARELNGIAEPLLGVEQDRPARERRIAEPQRLREIAAPGREIRRPPTPFEFLPAALEVALQEPKTAPI